MASRSPLFLFSAAVLLIPASVFAQATPANTPPDSEQALRANVNAFFQDFVDGKFRPALQYVAEDTQDLYFSSQKQQIKKFKVGSIEYLDSNHSKAVVKVDVTVIQHWRAEGFAQDVDLDAAWETNWKIEDGKWLYYEKSKGAGQMLTPMGPSADLAAAAEAARKEKKEINDGTMATEAQRILDATGKGTGVTPSVLTFALDKASSATVTFHNGVPGAVSIGVEGLPADVEGLTYKVAQVNVKSGADGTIEFQYNPPAGAEVRNLTAHLVVQPFEMEFPIQIHLGRP